jgi:hypothetical protein
MKNDGNALKNASEKSEAFYFHRNQNLCLFLVLCKAFAAQDRSVILWLERHASFAATFCANCSEVLSLGLICILSLLTALFASLRLILEAFFCIEFLFACSKHEFCAAFLAD